MACNVYFSFFCHYDAPRLRGLEWKYLVFCYGVPLIPAFTFCFVHTAERGMFYGPANIWCWVASPWRIFRIATFYAPVWIIIATIVFIYVRVGIVIFKWRKQMLSVGTGSGLPQIRTGPVGSSTEHRASLTTQGLPNDQISHHNHAKDSPSQNSSSNGSTWTTSAAQYPKPQQEPRDTDDAESFNRRQSRVRAVDANRTAIKYCKTAMLFFVALFCTWVPSTINRVYSLVYPDHAIFGLLFISSLLLPLQGFWNAILYIATSLPATKSLVETIRSRCFPRRSPHTTATPHTATLGASQHIRPATSRIQSNGGQSQSMELDDPRRRSLSNPRSIHVDQGLTTRHESAVRGECNWENTARESV